MRQLKITHKITTRESLALDKYLTEIGKVKLLTAQEEVELAVRIKQVTNRETASLDKYLREGTFLRKIKGLEYNYIYSGKY